MKWYRCLVTSLLAFLAALPCAAQLSCPSNPPLRSEKGPYNDHVLAHNLTAQEFDEWLSNLRYICEDGNSLLGDPHWKAPVADRVTLNLSTGTAGECHMLIDTGDRCCWSTDSADWACGAAATSASSISVTDTANHYTGTNVETVTAEIGDALDLRLTQSQADARYSLLSHTHVLADITDAGTAAAKDVPASGNAAAGEVVLGSDTRLSDSRMPSAHASTHAAAGSDPITISPSQAGLGSVTNDAQTKASVVPNTAPAAAQVLVGNLGGTAYVPRSISGDFTLDSTGATTLASVITSGSCGDATHSCTITYDAKGRLIGVASNSISAGANPAGTGTELQYRSSASAFGAVTSSSVSGADVTLGGKLTLPSGGQMRIGTTVNDAMFKAAGAAAIMSCRKGDDSDYCILNAERFRAWPGSGSAPDVVMQGGGGVEIGISRQYTISGSTDATQSADTGLKRVVGKVWGFTDGGAGGGTWQAGDPGTRPTCDSTVRGRYWHDQGGTGVADSIAICCKTAADTYVWATALGTCS